MKGNYVPSVNINNTICEMCKTTFFMEKERQNVIKWYIMKIQHFRLIAIIKVALEVCFIVFLHKKN